jgi:hypothetical protein
VPKLHHEVHIPEACPSAYKVFFFSARGAYVRPRQQRSWNWFSVSEPPPEFHD